MKNEAIECQFCGQSFSIEERFYPLISTEEPKISQQTREREIRSHDIRDDVSSLSLFLSAAMFWFVVVRPSGASSSLPKIFVRLHGPALLLLHNGVSLTEEKQYGGGGRMSHPF